MDYEHIYRSNWLSLERSLARWMAIYDRHDDSRSMDWKILVLAKDSQRKTMAADAFGSSRQILVILGWLSVGHDCAIDLHLHRLCAIYVSKIMSAPPNFPVMGHPMLPAH